jgi:hypothetical protein
MRALLITAAVVTAAIMLGGCPNKRPEPVPGPQSAPTQGAVTAASAQHSSRASGRALHQRGTSEISWFQGTLEEAFSRRHCGERQPLFRY